MMNIADKKNQSTWRLSVLDARGFKSNQASLEKKMCLTWILIKNVQELSQSIEVEDESS